MNDNYQKISRDNNLENFDKPFVNINDSFTNIDFESSSEDEHNIHRDIIFGPSISKKNLKRKKSLMPKRL